MRTLVDSGRFEAEKTLSPPQLMKAGQVQSIGMPHTIFILPILLVWLYFMAHFACSIAHFFWLPILLKIMPANYVKAYLQLLIHDGPMYDGWSSSRCLTFPSWSLERVSICG